MAVADPALPSTGVGAKAFSAPASEIPATATIATMATRATMARMVRRAGIRVTSAALPTHGSPLPADAEGEHALGEGRVPRLVLPYKVVVLVLVGEVGAVHEHFEVLAELVGHRCVEVSLRRLVLFHAGDAAHAIHIGFLRTVIVGHTGLEVLVLVPEDEVPRLFRVVLKRNLVSVQIGFTGFARRIREVEFHAGVGEEPRKERESLAIVEFDALDAVARTLQRLGDRNAMVADHTVLV